MRKLRNTGSSIDVSGRLSELTDRLKAVPHLVAAFVYGSYGTPDQTPLSDIDLALLFEPDREPSFDDKLDLIGLVTSTLHEDDASVTVLNEAPPVFQFRVIDTGRLFLCRDAAALADFKATVFSRYADFMIDFRQFAREYDEALREAYGHE